MRCERVSLVDRVTGAATRAQAEEIERHLAGCGSCRAELAALEETWEMLGALEPPVPSDSTGAAFGRLLEAAGARGAGRRPGRRVLAAAAAIAIVVSGGVIGQVLVDRDRGALATVRIEAADAVSVRLARGDVLLRAHDDSSVRVESRGFGDEEPRPPSIARENGHVTIRHEDGGPAIDLVVTVPARAELQVDVGRGQVRLRGVAGRTLVTVRRGDIAGSLRPSGEPVTLSTRSGNIGVAVPADVRADLEILCAGEFETDFRLYWRGGRLGGGGAPLELLAADGNCALRKS